MRKVSLADEGSAVFVEKKSEFIGYACPVETEEAAIAYVHKIRQKHADARHNVYAYVVGNTARYSDDGEPQGTAGLPVLDVIRKNGFSDAVIVVTRYFGGILLGAGGLVRAYSSAAKRAVDAAKIVTYVEYDELSFSCTYAEYPKIENALPNLSVITDQVTFSERICLHVAVKCDQTEALEKYLSECSAGKIITRKIGRRFDREI